MPDAIHVVQPKALTSYDIIGCPLKQAEQLLFRTLKQSRSHPPLRRLLPPERRGLRHTSTVPYELSSKITSCDSSVILSSVYLQRSQRMRPRK